MVKIIYYLIPYVIALFTVIIFGYLKNKKIILKKKKR